MISDIAEIGPCISLSKSHSINSYTTTLLIIFIIYKADDVKTLISSIMSADSAHMHFYCSIVPLYIRTMEENNAASLLACI